MLVPGVHVRHQQLMTKRRKLSPTSYSCHQKISSPIFVTNIDETLFHFRIQHVVIWMSKQLFKNAGSQIKFPQIPMVKIFSIYYLMGTFQINNLWAYGKMQINAVRVRFWNDKGAHRTKITSSFMDQVQEIIPDFHGMRKVQNYLNFSMLNIRLTCIARFGFVYQKKVSLVLNCVIMARRTQTGLWTWVTRRWL